MNERENVSSFNIGFSAMYPCFGKPSQQLDPHGHHGSVTEPPANGEQAKSYRMILLWKERRKKASGTNILHQQHEQPSRACQSDGTAGRRWLFGMLPTHLFVQFENGISGE